MSSTYKGYQSITSKAMKAEMLDQDVELELRIRDGENPNSDPKMQKLVKFLGASSTKGFCVL